MTNQTKVQAVIQGFNRHQDLILTVAVAKLHWNLNQRVLQFTGFSLDLDAIKQFRMLQRDLSTIRLIQMDQFITFQHCTIVKFDIDQASELSMQIRFKTTTRNLINNNDERSD